MKSIMVTGILYLLFAVPGKVQQHQPGDSSQQQYLLQQKKIAAGMLIRWQGMLLRNNRLLYSIIFERSPGIV